MAVIKKLGDRVEREHGQFLRDSQRLEDRSAVPVSGAEPNPVGGEVNFENLVGGGDGVAVKQDTAINGSSKGWDEDDVWGSIFSSSETVSIDSFASVHVYLSFPDLLGHHTNSASSTGHPNYIVFANFDASIQFDFATNTIKFKPKRSGSPANLIQLLQFIGSKSHQYVYPEPLDPSPTTARVKQLALDPHKHQQLLDPEL